MKPAGRNRSDSGQALLEFAVTVVVVGGVLLATGALLLSGWKRARCARNLFEETRARLEGFQVPSGIGARFEDGPGYLEGSVRCEGVHERIRLPKLD